MSFTLNFDQYKFLLFKNINLFKTITSNFEMKLLFEKACDVQGG